MKGLTKLRHYGLLCKHKAISILEVSIMLRIVKDTIENNIPTLELINICCTNTRL